MAGRICIVIQDLWLSMIVTVSVYKNTTQYKIANTIPVPADASLVVISRDNQVYLEESDSVRISASANSDLQAVCSWEEIN